MTRDGHEDGRTEGEIIDDLGNVLANFGADSLTEDPEQVAEHDRLLALPRTYSLPPGAPAADAGIVARLLDAQRYTDPDRAHVCMAVIGSLPDAIQRGADVEVRVLPAPGKGGESDG